MKKPKATSIYLDYAGATMMDKKVAKIIDITNKNNFANPSAIHKAGVRASEAINEARKKIASLLGVHSDEIIFTGSGTESVALALFGVINNYELLIIGKNKIPHIITTNIEHSSILENCKILKEKGLAEITYIPIEANGIVDPKKVKEALKENTVLVTIMYANNEIGTIQPIKEIAKEIRHFRKARNEKYDGISGHGYFPLFPYFHTDACQAMNYLETDNMDRLGVDMMTFNGAKIYGPKGIGVLYKKRSVELQPIYKGGEQEFGLRSGTENISSIVGLAEALSIACKIKEKESKRLINLRDYTINKLLKLSKESGYNIELNGDKEKRLPNNINISVDNLMSELLVIELDAKGFFVSEKSACHSKNNEPSHVIEALRKAQGVNLKNENGSIRISLGRETRKEDINHLIIS